MRSSRCSQWLPLLSLFTACLIHAQGPTGEIDGIVTDPTGSAIQGAEVTVSTRRRALREPRDPTLPGFTVSRLFLRPHTEFRLTLRVFRKKFEPES